MPDLTVSSDIDSFMQSASRQAAMDNLAGATTSGQYLRGNGSDVVMSAIQAADVPTLNQNTTGTAAGLSSTLAVGSGGTGATTLTGVLKGNGTGAVTAAAQLAIADGGTGATTGAEALANLGNSIFPVTVRQFNAMAPASSTATTMTFAVGVGIGGTAAIEGVTLAQGDTVVLLNNADQTQRGPWVITTLGTASVAAVLTRPSWFTTGTAKSGTLCQVQLGTASAGYVLVLTAVTATTTPIVIGTTSIFVTQIWGRIGLATTGGNVFSGPQTLRANGSGAQNCPLIFQAGVALMGTPIGNAVEWFNDTLFLTTAAGVRTTNVVSTTIPATSTSAGIVGQTAIDNTNNWFYICTATNVWKRIALTTF